MKMKMKMNNYYKIRNEFFKDVNGNNNSFLVYAYLVGLIEEDG